MNAVMRAPLLLLSVLMVSGATLGVGTALGATPTTVTKTHQPSGTPIKASSFAPHPTRKRAFGAPIQPPILGHVAPKKQPPH